ncbi:MAG: efflux RND transporter periplasmic adaptor subunit [Burkholderiales bacterium]|nr:efflux RND transporter periplasmic adaptor subunit [Burkholderiales bacterium]
MPDIIRRPTPSAPCPEKYSMRAFFLSLAAALALPAYAQADSLAAATTVVTKPLSQVAIYPERVASAQTVSLNESRIAAEISGRIEAIPVRVGERLARGAVLARIECRDHELARERANSALVAAQARLSLAVQQLARARELSTRGFISKEALTSRETEVQVFRADAEQARAQLDTAARSVGKCTVRSPFAAIVRERLGQVGELAAPGSPLVALSDAERVEVSAQLQLQDAESLSKAPVLRFAAFGGAKELALLRISPAINPQARTVEARLSFKGEPAAAGASGSVSWQDTRPHIPAEFVVRREGRLGVFVDEGGVARFHPLGEAQEGRPAQTGLPLGMRIVVSGQLALRDGQPLAAARK